MTPYERAVLWSRIEMVATAIRDQAHKQDLAMVKDRHAYLASLLDQMAQGNEQGEGSEQNSR